MAKRFGSAVFVALAGLLAGCEDSSAREAREARVYDALNKDMRQVLCNQGTSRDRAAAIYRISQSSAVSGELASDTNVDDTLTTIAARIEKDGCSR